MRLVLDANEYIFALGFFKKESCKSLIKFLIENPFSHPLCISRTIAEEVKANLTLREFHIFFRMISTFTTIDEDFLIPFELGAKYENLGLKPADAMIGAYAEWSNADALVTENRHFLSRQKDLPFNILNAEGCLKILVK